MLWKKELIKQNRIYVNIFRANDLFSMFDHLFDDSDSNGHEKTIAKNNKMSDDARRAAVKMTKEKQNPEEILQRLNEAICFAEIDCEQIGLAYGLRAACFNKLKEFSLCLADIELAKKHKYPADALSRLEELQGECFKKLGRKNGQVIDEPKLSLPADTKIPCFAQGLEVKHTKKYGKHIVTTRDLEIGQTVIVEEAFGIASDIEQNYSQCANCFVRKANLVPCPKCAAVMFCSQKCYDVAHQKFHAFECGKRHVCNIWESVPRLVMRTVINAIKLFPKIEELMTIIDNFNNGKPNHGVNYADPSIQAYMRFFWLNKSVESTPHMRDMRDRTKTIHSIIATSPEYKSMFGSLDESRFLAHLILHHFYVVDANGFDAFSLLHRTFTAKLGASDSENINGFEYAHGLYLNSCQLNHSCQPNIARIFIGDKLVGKVIRPIKRGEQLFVSYLNPLDLVDPTPYRRAILKSKHYIECKCKSCVAKIPPFNSRGEYDIDVFVRRLLGLFAKSPGTDPPMKSLTANRDELLKFEKSIFKYLQSNDRLHPTAETLVIQFLLMQIWNNLGR